MAFKDDPPANYERKDSFHESEADFVPVSREGSKKKKKKADSSKTDSGFLGTDDCGMYCDPANVLRIFSGGNADKESKGQDESSSHASEPELARKPSADSRSTDSQQRGRFLIWPVSPS